MIIPFGSVLVLVHAHGVAGQEIGVGGMILEHFSVALLPQNDLIQLRILFYKVIRLL